MNTKAIIEAIDAGQDVVLSNDPLSRICKDLFGNLVVVSRADSGPVRLATLSDKRRAQVLRQHV